MQWPDEVPEDIDPGKDIFALLFLSFFLINAILLFCISGRSQEAVRVNTATGNEGVQIEPDMLSQVELVKDKVKIVQKSGVYFLPGDLQHFKDKASYQTRKTGDLPQIFITARDPGISMTAGEMLTVVRMLNRLDIGIDFRTIPEKGG